jgi:hypothetical protein
MLQIGNRKTRLQPDAGDALPMGAFRPNPSWYEEHWLREARPAPPSVIRQCLVRLALIARALIKLPRPSPSVRAGTCWCLNRKTLTKRTTAVLPHQDAECSTHLAASAQVSNWHVATST